MNRNYFLRWVTMLPVLAVSLLWSSGTAWALDLRIDFAANSTTGNPGGNWNTLSSPSATVSDLIDFGTGAGSGVNLAFTQPLKGPGHANAGQWSGTPLYSSWIDPKATNDYFYIQASPNPGLMTFSGLDPNASYRVEVLGSRSTQGLTLQADYQVQDTFSRNGSDGYDAYVDGYTNHKVMTWRDVRAATGEITLKMDDIGDSLAGYLSAMQIFEEQRLLIDLGRAIRTTPGNWNNITTEKGSGGTDGPGHVLIGAIDAAGVETGVKVNVLAPFQAYNDNGVGTAQSGYPYEARSDSFATGSSFPKATLQLEGLTPGDRYDVILFGSRANTGEVREAKYTVGGVSKNLVNTDNASNVVRFYDVAANARGHIQIDTEIANGSFSYLGVIEVVGSFASDPVGPSILVDFGSSAAGYTTRGHWNNLATDSSSGGTGLTGLTNMVDSLGNTTRVDLAITNDFGGRNNVGEVFDDAGFPTTAQRDSFFVQSTDPAEIVLTGLHPSAGYDLTFFGSRRESDAPTGDLFLDVTINGETLSLDTRGNVDDVITFTNILPDSTGRLEIDFTSARIGYLGAMAVTMIVPEPGSFLMMAIALVGFLGLRRRQRPRG